MNWDRWAKFQLIIAKTRIDLGRGGDAKAKSPTPNQKLYDQ